MNFLKPTFTPITLIIIVIIILVAIFSYGISFSEKNTNNFTPVLNGEEIIKSTTPEIATKKEEEPEIARLRMGNSESSEIRILTNVSMTTRNFDFIDNKTGDKVSEFTVLNYNIEAPYYNIIKGQKHDWLVVTRIEASGTGLLIHVNEWYVLGMSGTIKMVLSYPSQGHWVPDDDGKNRYLKTDIMNEQYQDDSAVDIKSTIKSCFTTEMGENKDCSEISDIDHYVWDSEREEFILNPKK